MNRITLKINKERQNVGKVRMIIDPEDEYVTIKNVYGVGRSCKLKRKEKTFCNWLKMCYGTGEYAIVMRGRRYARRFWRGIIMLDRFIRYTDPDTITYISRYFFPAKPVGKYHYYK